MGIAGGTTFDNLSKVVADLKIGGNRAIGASFVFRAISESVFTEKSTGRALSFEIRETTTENLARIFDIKVVDEEKVFEFKSVKWLPSTDFVLQFTKDLEIYGNRILDGGIQWFF